MATNRRRFLVGCGVAGGAVAIGAAAFPTARQAATIASLRRLIAILPGSAHTRDIGVEYRHRFPNDLDEGALASLLSDLADRFSLFGTLERQVQRVEAAIRADFERGDVVRFGGWVLSRTGVRLCALSVASSELAMGIRGVFAPSALPSGESFSWLTPNASFVLSASDQPVDVDLRSGAGFTQTVTFRVGQQTVSQVAVSDATWHHHGLEIQRNAGAPIVVRVTTAPSWTPANDFRTLGVGMARAPWNSWR